MKEKSSSSLHPPVRAACVAALKSIFLEGRHAEKVVDYHLKNQKKFGGRDRRALAETVYEVVRHFRRFAVLAGFGKAFAEGAGVSESRPAVDGAATATGRANYRLDDPQAIDKILEVYLQEKSASRDSSVNRETQGRADKGETASDRALTRAETESIPDWLDARGEQELGPKWPGLLHALNNIAPQFLRANTLKVTAPELQKVLSREEIATALVENVPTALRLEQRKNVFQTEAFKKGLFEMQDGGSQLIAPLLQVEPGQRVIDACAGAGGKTLHLAALMQNKGKIIALDVHEWKLKELKTRAARAGASIIETRSIENTKTIKRLHDSADRVLLDVPCSGLGVLRRHPDTKWKLTSEELLQLNTLQDEILTRYSPMVRSGGLLVYATCSLLPSENSARVKAFLEREKGRFQLEEERHVSPIETPFDGFYAARLKRISS